MAVVSLATDRSLYAIRFANDAASLLAFEFTDITLPTPVSTIFTTTSGSSSMYIAPLTAAQVTNVIATYITVDAGVAPPSGGGIEVRRSDAGWVRALTAIWPDVHHPDIHSAAAVARADLLLTAVRRIVAGKVLARLGAAAHGLSIMKPAISDLEQKVLSDLAEVKAHMRWLIGKWQRGQDPGTSRPS